MKRIEFQLVNGYSFVTTMSDDHAELALSAVGSDRHRTLHVDGDPKAVILLDKICMVTVQEEGRP